jgi:hypothetical protein
MISNYIFNRFLVRLNEKKKKIMKNKQTGILNDCSERLGNHKSY